MSADEYYANDVDPEDFIHPLCQDRVVLRRARLVLIEMHHTWREVAQVRNDMTIAEEAIGRIIEFFTMVNDPMFMGISSGADDNDDDDDPEPS